MDITNNLDTNIRKIDEEFHKFQQEKETIMKGLNDIALSLQGVIESQQFGRLLELPRINKELEAALKEKEIINAKLNENIENTKKIYDGQIEILKKTNASANNKIFGLTNENNKLLQDKSVNEEKIKDLEPQLANNRAKYARLEEQINQVNNEKTQLTQELTSIKTQIANIQNENQRLTQEITSNKQQLTKLKTSEDTINSLKSALEQNNIILQQLETDKKALENQLSENKINLQRLETDNNNLKTSITDMLTTNKKASEQIDTITKNLKEQHNTFETKIQQLESEKTQLKQQQDINNGKIRDLMSNFNNIISNATKEANTIKIINAPSVKALLNNIKQIQQSLSEIRGGKIKKRSKKYLKKRSSQKRRTTKKRRSSFRK
jgi:chromosome segregation ATPase